MVLLVVLSGIASAAIMFTDKVDYRTGRGPSGIYAADFDGDGDKDVVTTNCGGLWAGGRLKRQEVVIRKKWKE